MAVIPKARSGRWKALLVAAVCVACNDVTAVDQEPKAQMLPEPALVSFFGENAEAVKIDTEGRATARMPLPGRQAGMRLSPDGERFVAIAAEVGSGLDYRLIVASTDPLEVVRSEPLTAISKKSDFGPVDLTSEVTPVFSSGGSTIYVKGIRGGSGAEGLVPMDLESLTPLGIAGEFLDVGAPGGATVLPRGEGKEDLLLAAGAMEVLDPEDVLVSFEAGSLELQDTLRLGDTFRGGTVSEVRTVLANPRGDRVFVQTVDSLHAVGVSPEGALTRRRSVAAPHARGNLTLSPTGDRLYLSDSGDGFDDPGSGLIRVFDAALHELPPVDLRGVSIPGGANPSLGPVDFTRDGTPFVAAGTSGDGPLFRPQPGHLLVVDRGDGSLLADLDFGRFDIGHVVVLDR